MRKAICREASESEPPCCRQSFHTAESTAAVRHCMTTVYHGRTYFNYLESPSGASMWFTFALAVIASAVALYVPGYFACGTRIEGLPILRCRRRAGLLAALPRSAWNHPSEGGHLLPRHRFVCCGYGDRGYCLHRKRDHRQSNRCRRLHRARGRRLFDA